MLDIPPAQHKVQLSAENAAAVLLEEVRTDTYIDSARAGIVRHLLPTQSDSTVQEALNSQQSCQELRTEGSVESPSLGHAAEESSGGAPIIDGQPAGLGQPGCVRVTWGAGVPGGVTGWRDLRRIACDDAVLNHNAAGQCDCQTTAESVEGTQDMLLLQRPNTGKFGATTHVHSLKIPLQEPCAAAAQLHVLRSA